MKLNAVERPSAVADSHDLIFVRPGADDKIGIFESLTANHQAVIACRLKRVGQPFEDALAVMMNPRSLAVHNSIIADNFAAENMADALMPQTDSQNWYRQCKPLDDLV